VTDAEVLPASFAQQQLWFLDQLMPGNPVYNMSATARLSGALNIAALELAVSEVVCRHQILRTTFREVGGLPYQVVRGAQQLMAEVVDVSEAASPDAAAKKLIRAKAREAFGLDRWPLLRVTVVRLDRLAHIFLVTMHHIISDEWSATVLAAELNSLYAAFSAGRPAELKPLPLQYGDFAVWQRSRLEDGELDQQRAYWRGTLTGMSAPLELPSDYPRPSVRSYGGAEQFFHLSPELANQVTALARQERATVFMTLLAVFQLFLCSYTGVEDIAVGSHVAGRMQEELEPLIGCFVNTIILRSNFSGDPTFREVLSRVRDVAIGAYSNQDVPFEQIIEDLAPPRERSRNPLVEIFFIMRNVSRVPLSLPGLTTEGWGDPNLVARFDVSLIVEESEEGMLGSFVYSTELFKQETASRFAEHFANLLEDVVSNPEKRISEMSMLGSDEYHRIVMEWSTSSPPSLD
jgi:hypothetical protein